MEIKVEYRGHRTCSIIRGKIRPKVKFDRGCRMDWVPDVREDIHRIYARIYVRMHAVYMSDTRRIGAVYR